MIRKKPGFREIPFILLSHEFKDELFKTAIKERIDDFYVLPLPKVEDLLNRIEFLNKYHQKYPFTSPVFKLDEPIKIPRSKRLFDLVVAISALFFLSPLLIPVIIAIWLESKMKGKVYYTSKRFGNGKIFDFYKLRSMRIGSDAQLAKLAIEKNQYIAEQKPTETDFTIPCPACAKLSKGKRCSPVVEGIPYDICENWYNHLKVKKAIFTKISKDPRVTRVGKFIRKTSIDELPQLINVIKGDMSIVGNRPLPIYEVEHLLRDSEQRFHAPAGITGLWQVELRGHGGVMSEAERKRLDNEYAEYFLNNKYSFMYDLKLVFRTFKALFQKDSA